MMRDWRALNQWTGVVMMVLSVSLVLVGCSKRGVYSSTQGSSAKASRVSVHPQEELLSLDELALEDAVLDGGDMSGRSSGHDIASDPLDESQQDTVLSAEDLAIGDGAPSDRAQRFRDARHRAELMADRSGLHDVFFEFDSWELTPRAKQTLAANAKLLRSTVQHVVTIEGHCDERGTHAYNYVLGEKRALRTKNYLMGLGVPSERLRVVSYGKDQPVCGDLTSGCLKQNRRAHLLLGTSMTDADL